MAGPRVNVTIGANVTPFQKGINAAMGSLRRFIAVGAIIQMTRNAIALGSSLTDMSAKAGVSVKWLQEVGFAAKTTGSTIEELTESLFELKRAQARALSGRAAESGAFASLGINRSTLATADTATLFDRVADAIHRSRGGLREFDAALRVLGSNGRNLIAGMVEGFGDIRKQAQGLGVVLTDEEVSRLDQLGDQLDILHMKWSANLAAVVAFTSKLSHLGKIITGIGQVTWLTIRDLPQRRAWENWDFFKEGINSVYDSVADDMVAESAALEKGKNRNAPIAAQASTLQGARSSVPTADALQRIGLYAGGGPSAQSTRQQQVTLLRRTVAELQQLRREVQRNTTETKIDW